MQIFLLPARVTPELDGSLLLSSADPGPFPVRPCTGRHLQRGYTLAVLSVPSAYCSIIIDRLDGGYYVLLGIPNERTCLPSLRVDVGTSLRAESVGSLTMPARVGDVYGLEELILSQAI